MRTQLVVVPGTGPGPIQYVWLTGNGQEKIPFQILIMSDLND